MKPCKFCQGTGKINNTDFLSENEDENLGNNGEPIKNPNPECDEDQVENERLKS